MFTRKDSICLIAGLVVRLFLIFHEKFRRYFEESPEFTTPLTSWKRVVEGIYLRDINVSPFAGSIVHETPIAICFFSKIFTLTNGHVEGFFIGADLFTAFLTYKIARKIAETMFDEEEKDRSKFNLSSKILWLKREDIDRSAFAVLLCATFNPFSIGTCVAKSSLIFHNLLLTITFYSFLNRQLILFILSLALASSISLYPIILLVPAVLQFSLKANNERSISRMVLLIILFVIANVAVLFVNYTLNHQSFSFLESTYSFIFHVPDYTPNIGIFWYFFTEMFDHFRSLFVWTFQMHVLVLYIVPFAIRLRRDSTFLFWLSCAIFCTFKSYPTYGDAAFYFNYLPIWGHLFRYVRHSLVIMCMVLVAFFMAPITWYLWIYTGSANANFYFAMTMVFNVAQTFLVSDLLYAYLKRKFFLEKGLDIPNFEGNEGQLEFY